jgi:hypothetical protein
MGRFEVQEQVGTTLLDNYDELEWGDYLPRLTEDVTSVIYNHRVFERASIPAPLLCGDCQ